MMTFPRFHNKFAAELPATGSYQSTPEGFIEHYGGLTFHKGLLRVHTKESASKWLAIVRETFPNRTDLTHVFCYTWLGDQFGFAAQTSRVYMFEPGFGECLIIAEDFLASIEKEFVDQTDAAFAESFFHQWMRVSGTELAMTQCAGYVQPLFLGGKDSVDNLAIYDMEVYWGLCGQILAQI